MSRKAIKSLLRALTRVMRLDTSTTAETAPAASKSLTKAEQAELAQLELDISELEGLLKAYDAMLNQAGGDYEAMEKTMAERADAAAKLDAKTERWLMLAER